ncbi:endonuclease [Kaistella solincola]|uniref:Endonuclease n=1 Tax=Kaistella solincola TaxID=510955 RepID=A0ABR4ZR93_9FLAO|nr:DNA-formamidopyrimidine glycosylase family protein [Kaistella solincola]KIA83710.1 endonuclease [Kaistella solincola]
MPEGPSIKILKDLAEKFIGQEIISASGNAKIEMDQLPGKTFEAYKTYGKQSYLVCGKLVVRIHLLLWGSYSLDEQTKPNRQLRLHLKFENGDLYFYSCSVKLLDSKVLKEIDWNADVLSDEWKPLKAKKKLKLQPEMLVCDALMDQNIFSGVGNIIKNEVLFRIGVHPESLIGRLPPKKLSALIFEARNYSFDFLRWKKEYVLKKNWLVHTKKICPKCGENLTKRHTGLNSRRSFFCEKNQKLYQ